MSSPFLGIVRVYTDFEKPPGDGANQASFNFPIRQKCIMGSSVEELVGNSKNYSDEYVNKIVQITRELIEEGAVAIITTCGFLAIIHPILRKEFPGYPLGTSSLLQIPIANNLISPGTRVGVITFDGDVLGEQHLEGVGAEVNTPIVGVRKGCSFDRLVRDCIPYDFNAHKQDILDAADLLIATYDNIGGIVLECANMGPFRNAVHKHTGLPVWDIITLGNFVYDIGLAKTFIN